MKESMSIQKFNELLKAGKSEDSLLATLLQLTKVSNHKDLSELRKTEVWGWYWDWQSIVAGGGDGYGRNPFLFFPSFSDCVQGSAAHNLAHFSQYRFVQTKLNSKPKRLSLTIVIVLSAMTSQPKR